MPLVRAKPFAPKKFATVNGKRMAYVEAGARRARSSSSTATRPRPTCGATSCRIALGVGRLIACDLIGMGDSDKLENSGPGATPTPNSASICSRCGITFDARRRVVLVLHDWGSALGFDWAFHNRARVAGIVYMEAIVAPLSWADWPENARRAFQGFRSDKGEEMILAEQRVRRARAAGSVDPSAHRRGDGRLPRAVSQSRARTAARRSPGRA